MSQTDMLRTKDEARSALDRGAKVECRSREHQPEWLPLVSHPDDLGDGWQFRIASPSSQAAPADGLSESPQDEVALEIILPDLPAPTFHTPNTGALYSRVQMIDYARAAASALLARRPCAQGHGEPVAWRFYSAVFDDWSTWSTDPSFRRDRESGGHRGEYAYSVTSPPAAPDSTHAAQAPVKELPAWPTREQFREVAMDAFTKWNGVAYLAEAIADRLHAEFVGGRDGEGS